ncbi:hypothetical protein MIND_01375200 [Mycena indigotica]|uniref:Uncharacterized protein n=1 Tax=Mycena indigotica TaxID=2126181 RepID=A0A8H6VPC0_9AGAR|nr:uncharacterized protein MIND_01375200 [Mycena indigotica]KAF7289142.1 hypothetical protein MIND_01375200 [Mycena indigotica]
MGDGTSAEAKSWVSNLFTSRGHNGRPHSPFHTAATSPSSTTRFTRAVIRATTGKRRRQLVWRDWEAAGADTGREQRVLSSAFDVYSLLDWPNSSVTEIFSLRAWVRANTNWESLLTHILPACLASNSSAPRARSPPAFTLPHRDRCGIPVFDNDSRHLRYDWQAETPTRLDGSGSRWDGGSWENSCFDLAKACGLRAWMCVNASP